VEIDRPDSFVVGFALLWFLILLYHGDLEPLTPTDYQPCVAGVKSFASIFLFSLETQHTIGYGTRYIQDNCPDAILLLILQSITGILIEAFVVGVVFGRTLKKVYVQSLPKGQRSFNFFYFLCSCSKSVSTKEEIPNISF